jgi:hypothetical protein
MHARPEVKQILISQKLFKWVINREKTKRLPQLLARRVVPRSTVQLENAIRHFIDDHNQNPKLSSGPNRPTRSSNPSPAFANEH